MSDTPVIYRFGIVGCGAISDLHADAIRSLPDARLVAAVDTQADKVGAFAARHQCDAHTDLTEMLMRPDIDVVCVCAPSFLHAEIGIEVARAGKHVVVEKPMALTCRDADALMRACEQYGVRLLCILQRRFDPDLMAVKRMVDDGYLGELKFAQCSVAWYRDEAYYSQSPWRGTYRYDGGGVLMNQAIHHVDSLFWLCGALKSVLARCARLYHDIEAEDAVSATLQFESGALGNLWATTCAWPGVGADIALYGSDGSIRMRDGKLLAACHKHRPWTLPEVTFDPVGGDGARDVLGISQVAHAKELRAFLDAIRDDRPTPVDGLQGRAALRVIEAIYESSRAGTWVDV